MKLKRHKDSMGEEFRERILGEIQKDKLSLSELRTRDRKLGRVLATSGFKVTGSGVESGLGPRPPERRSLRGERGTLHASITRVRCSGEISLTGTCQQPRRDGHHGTRLSGFFTDVYDFTALEPGRPVNKGGAASGWSRGHINEIRSQVRFPGGPPEGTTECCAVGTDRSYPFSSNGDSGAWVTSIIGFLGGLLVGCHTAGGWGYVTPIQDVMEDIESSLGCEVVLPGEIGSRYRYR